MIVTGGQQNYHCELFSRAAADSVLHLKIIVRNGYPHRLNLIFQSNFEYFYLRNTNYKKRFFQIVNPIPTGVGPFWTRTT